MMDSGIQAPRSNSVHQPYPGVGQDFGYSSLQPNYQYSAIDSANALPKPIYPAPPLYHHTPMLRSHPAPTDAYTGPPDPSYFSNGRLNYQNGGIGVGRNPLPEAPFRPMSDNVQAPPNFSAFPPNSDVPTQLSWLSSSAFNVLMSVAHLVESQLRELWRVIGAWTEGTFIAFVALVARSQKVPEAESLDRLRSRMGPTFSQSMPSHSSRSSTRNPTNIVVGQGAEMPPSLLPHSQPYSMGESPRDLTSLPSHNWGHQPSPNDAPHVSAPSYGDPDCGPQHDAGQDHCTVLYDTNASQFPQAVFGSYSNSSQNNPTTLSSSAPIGLTWGSMPPHPSAPNAPVLPPAPGVLSGDLTSTASHISGYPPYPHFNDATPLSHTASTSSMAANSVPSFGNPDYGPQHEAEEDPYTMYYPNESASPLAVVGPHLIPQNSFTTLPSSAPNALASGSPSHLSVPNAPTSPPAPGVPSKELKPKKELKPGLCAECGKTESTYWRRDPTTKAQLCNYCGQKAYKKKEPQ
ncbi:hypothetical protein B0H13DRAFT_2375369 [Mycena leptocephala]|nr:hypothetical protein B0H13DRAFT_2375369 [Mycena leptocephala]